jgi:hypothetical protein
MQQGRRLSLGIAAACALACVAAGAAERIGFVSVVTGGAAALREGAGEVALGQGADVFLNDKIVTKAGGKVTLQFTDGTTLSQGEKAELTLSEYLFNPDAKADNKFSAKLARGTFRVVTGKIVEMNPERFQVQTRRATLGFRGTDVLIVVDPDINVDEVYIYDLHGKKLVVIPDIPGADPVVIEQVMTRLRLQDQGMQQDRFTEEQWTQIRERLEQGGRGGEPPAGAGMEMPAWKPSR